MRDRASAYAASARAAIERAADEIVGVDPYEAAGLLGLQAAAWPQPLNVAHRAMLTAQIINLCVRLLERLHSRIDPSRSRCLCYADAWAQLGLFTRTAEGDPRVALVEWTRAVGEVFAASHPPTPGTQAAALMRAEPARAWSMRLLSRSIDTSPLRLRRDFHARFGMRVATYLQLVRSARAVALLGTDRKVEAVAWDVGYRSKKDLYAALRRWAGGTPTAVRALAADERLWLERVLIRRAISDGAAGRARSDRPGFPPRRPRRRGAQPRRR